MKHCPECNKNYADPTLSFCLQDGAPLIFGAALEESATAILSGDPPSEGQTRAIDPQATAPAATTSYPEQKADAFRWDIKHSLVIAGLTLVVILGSIFVYRNFNSPNAAQIDSLAVMPFVNESGDPNVEYLADGMTESLINSLTNLPNLSVKARNSVFRYKGSDIDEKKLGQDLSVQALLLGRVIQRGDNITLYLSLVDARTGTSLWGEQYDRKMQDVAVLQKDITRDVSQKLRDRLSNADTKELTRNYTDNAEAYQLYLKGRYFWSKRRPESIRKAVEYFDQAIEKDPGYALAYAGLADAYVVPASRIPPRDALPKAKAAAMRALEIDATLAEAHASLGRVLQVYDWNWPEAEKEFKRAIELNPRYAVAHQWYGGYLERTGHMDAGIAERKLALELDPLSDIANFELGQAFFWKRDYDEAIRQFEKILEVDAEFPPVLQYIPAAYAQKGMYDEAIRRIQRTPESADIASTGVPGYVFALAGRKPEARAMLVELKDRRVRDQEYVSPVSLALICVALGEKDEALTWLEKGYEERAFQMQFLNVDPRFDTIRSDPRFAELVRRIGLPT
jgi:TolB-like protein/Tfp pilus assembly protein PilF